MLLVNSVNFLAVFPAIPMLLKYGRRELLIFWSVVMCIALVTMTAFSQWFDFGAFSDYAQVGCLMVFVCGF